MADIKRRHGAPRLRVHSGARLAELPQVATLPESLKRDIRVVSQVLPFKVNDYVLDELIDWSDVPNDPIYRMTFPHRDMLAPEAGVLILGEGSADPARCLGRMTATSSEASSAVALASRFAARLSALSAFAAARLALAAARASARSAARTSTRSAPRWSPGC